MDQACIAPRQTCTSTPQKDEEKEHMSLCMVAWSNYPYFAVLYFKVIFRQFARNKVRNYQVSPSSVVLINLYS